MKYRIKTNLVKVLKKHHYEMTGLENMLINQLVEDVPETYRDLVLRGYGDRKPKFLEKYIVGRVESYLVRGTFIIPKEALERAPAIPYGEYER